MNITLFEKEYPAEYTLEVQEAMTEKFGGIGKEQMEAIFDTTDKKQFVSNMAFMAVSMMEAARHRASVRAKIMGDKFDPTEIPQEGEVVAIMEVMTPAEVSAMTGEIMLTITEGNRGKVKTKEAADSKKNGKSAEK